MKADVAQDEIIERLYIKAPPERIFRALTDPEQVPMWWGEEGAYRVVKWESDLKVGGDWRCEGVDGSGEPFTMQGKFVEITEPSKLVYTWNPYWVECAETTVEWVLEGSPEGTTITMTHRGFAGFPEARESHKGGWPLVIGWLTKYVEE